VLSCGTSRSNATRPRRRGAVLSSCCTRFGPPLRSNPLGEQMACKRTDTVVDYQSQFEALLPRAGVLTELQKVHIFTAGLLPPLSLDVEILNPQSLSMAMSLARKLELRNQCALVPASATATSRSSNRDILPLPPRPVLPVPPASAPPATPLLLVEGHPVKRLSQAEMEERRRQGLCFNCNK